MASGDKETFPVAGVIQSSSRIIISQQSPSPSPGASKPQSYKVFVLPPSQLNSLGLVAKNENGRVILTERAIESTVSHNAAPNSNAAMSLAFIKTPEGIQIQSGQSSSSVKTTPKRGYVASAEVVKGAARELQVHRPVTKISTPGTNALGASSSRPMFARRSSSRRLLPQFTNYWKSSLVEKGYIRCPLRDCNYICLNFGEMTIHYYQCKGEPFASKYICTPCNGRLKSEEDLKSHYIETHSREGRIARKPPPKKVVELPKPEEKAQVWIRKRAYSKVHKISWNIALEEKGYVNCFFKNCCFMALDLNQMIKHYGICNGTTAATSVECPYCEACAECMEKLEAHVKKAHSANPNISQVVNPEVNIAVSVSDSLPVPVPQTNIASAVSSGINIGSSFVHQEEETVILSKKQSRLTSIKISAPTDKTVHTVVSMTEKLPKSLDQSHSRLSSDTISKTSGSLSSSADTDVHCLFSMYEDFDEQRSVEREILDSHLGSVGLSIKKECENTSTVLCKTYSKDNQRLVRDETYNERISSPLSALPCSFSDNISLCTDLSDIQIMRSSMSEGANNVMLVETKPEACAVEKLHEYMSHCDSNILNEENVSYCGTSLNSKEQKEVSPKLSASQISNPVSQESNAPHYELFKDDEPEYPQEYSLNSSINKTVKSNDINLSQNDLEEDKQVTVEECLFAESYASNSLVSYTEDVEEYIIPEIVEMTQYLVESPVEVCSKAVNKRIQTPNEKQKIASSQVPTNKIENLVPAKSNVSNVCKNIENTNNNTAKANIDRPRSIHPVDSVKCTEPQAYNTLQRKVHSDIQVISQDNSCAVETSFTNIQPSHPLYADPDELQNLDVPILASVSVSKDMLNSVPNSQFIDVHHAESDLSEVNQELYLKKSVSGSLIISDTDKLTNSVKSVNIEVLEKKNLTEAESADTANGQFVPDDLCNARLICEVNIESENNVNLDVALNDNVLENVTEDSSARNQLSEISSLDISEEGVNNSLEQLSLKHKKNLSEIAINLPESEMSDRDLRDVKEKENALKVEHSSLKTLPQVHSIVEVVCSSGVQGETKISEVLADELQEPVQETTIQTASHTNASNILQLPLNNSVLKDEQDESIYTDVECRIDEFQNESNQTLRSYNSILPSHNLNQDSQTSSENISVDKVLDKTLRPATKVPKISHSTKEGICVVANANLKENSSQIKEQSLKSVSSEAAGEFSHFCEMKNTDCNSVSLGVSVLGDIQLHLDTNEKEIVRINTSHCEGLSYENESKSTKLTDLDSDVSSISVLKEEIELKIEENKSSNVELSDAKHSVPVVVKVEEFESNMKANEAKLSSVSFTDIEVERKDDHLHLDNIFSETCVSKDIPVSSQGGLMSTISETNAVISANSDVETAIKTLPDNKICHSLGNLPKDIESACAEDNMLESSSMAVNDLIVCTEQKYDNVKESISQGKDITLEIEKEDMNINNSKISGVFPSSQCLKSEDSSNIVSASIKEVNVEKMTNIENDERSDVISQILEHSDTLVDENQEIDSNNLKMLDGDLITTVAENVQEVNQLCPPSEASDSYNKVNVLPITVPLISVTLESDNQLDGKVNVVECSSSMEYVSKTTEGTSCNEKFPQNELPSKGMLASKEDIRENETQLVSEVIPQTQNVLQISDCVTPFVEDLGPISNKTNTDFPSTEEMNEKRVKKESENENNSINDYNALHVHLSTVSETNVDESNVEIMVEPLPEGKERVLLRSLPRQIGNTYNVKPSHEDNQLDSAEINDNTLESSAANDWIACLEQKSDGVEESFLEHKSDTFKVKNDDMSTSNTEVIKLLPDSQSPVLKDPSQIVSSIKEINVDEKANIKNGEKSVGRSQVLEHSDILENKSQEAATSNLKMLDDDLIVLDNAQDINRLYPPCEVTDSIDKMKPNTSKLISGSLESGRQSIAEIESNECTSLSDVSKATEEKNSQIEIVSEGGPLIQGITDSKKDTRENETQLMYKISPETQNTLQISECVTRFMEDIPVSNREIHECSSEEQMDVKIVREETEDEKISISVDDASCSHLNTDSESNILIAEKSNVAISVKPLCDDKKSDSLGSLSKEIDNTFNVMPSNEDNQLETSRMAISNLSRCSEQKYDKESSLEKDMTFKMVNKDVSTNSSKISGVLLDSQTSISEDPSKIVSASVKEVNIDKMTKIENVERSFVVSHAVVDSVTPHGNNQEADSNNMKILDGDLITTVADDVQEVNKLYSPTELPDSINKMDVLPPKIPLISGSFESDNQSNEDVGPIESLSLSDASQATEEKNCQIENVSERGLFPKVIPDSKDIGENVTSLVHEESSKTQNTLEASESVTPFVEDTKPETSREIHEFFSEEQMGVKIVTEKSKDEKISVIVDGASCLNMNITSESNELITEKNNIVKTLKPLCDDKESDLPKEVNNTLNVMSSDENNHVELSRMAVNDLSPCSEQKYDIAKESLLEIKDMSTNSSKISGVLSDSQTAITEDPSRIVSSSIKEINIDRMANIKNVEKSVSVSQVIMDYGTPQDDNQEADSNLKTLGGDLTTTVADDVQGINELYYSSSEFTDSINKMDVLPTTVPLVSGSLELDSHSNAQVDAVECTSLSNESKTTEEFYSSIENIPESGLILKQMSDSKKDIKENETQLCEESSETQTALQVSECVTPCVEDIVSVSNKKIQEFENTKVVTTSTDITEEQMEVKFGTEELVDKKILISDDEVSLTTNIGKVKSETLLSCVSEKTQEEGKALTSTDICSEVKIIENDVGFQDLTVDRESSEAKLIQETKNAEKKVCVVKEITVAERTVSSMKDNFLSAPDEECILMSCQKQDNVNIVVPSLLPLKKTNDTILSLTESSISEEPSIASECSLTGSPKIFQELGESCGYEKHLKPTSEALQSIKEENESSISEGIQEEAKEPSILSCNVNIVADTKNITGFDFNAKSNVLEYIKDQEEVLNAKAGLDKEIQEIIETKNENKISDSLVPLTEKSEQTKETTLGTEFSGTSLLETRTLLGREQNVLGGMSEQFINSPTSNEASLFSETTITLSENVKRLSLENLSIALAGEMEDSPEHVSSHEMLGVDSYSNKAHSDSKKLLIPRDAFSKSFENYALDSPKAVSESDEKIYSTQDLQQILEGSDDSKHKLEDEETSSSTVPSENVLCSNESKDMLKREENDPSHLHNMNEIVSSSDSVKVIEKTFETELTEINLSRDKDSSWRKRRHSTDFSIKMEIDGECANYCSPVKRKRSSSFCCDLTTNCEKNGKLHLLKSTLIKETMKSNEQLEKLESNANLSTSYSDITESCGPTDTQDFGEVTNQNKLSNEEGIVHTKGTSVTNSNLHKDTESKCMFHASEDSVSNTNIYEQNRKINEAIHLPLETNNVQVDAVTVTCLEEKNRFTPENKTDLVCTEPPRLRRKRSIETREEEAEVKRKSRRQSLRNKTIVSEDSNSSNSSVNSASDIVGGRKTRRGRKSRKVDDSVNTNVNSVSNTPQKENSEDTILKQTKTGNLGESETQQILPYDSEQSIMSEDSVFSKTDSLNEFDSSLEVDDSASSTVGSIISDDSKDWAEDSQIGIDQESDMSEIGTNCQGQGKGGGRGQSRRRNYRRGSKRRVHWRRRGVQKVGGREEEEESQGSSLPVDSGNSCAQEELMESNEIEQRREDPNEEIKCGKCKEKMKRKSYDRHNASIHNGLSWLEGEPPFDMSNEKLVLSTLWKVVKTRRFLTCENCGESKKSAVGFWSHIAFCQRSAEEREALKVMCDICGRYMIPASLKVHLQMHREPKPEPKPDPCVKVETTRTQRAAAAKATSLLQEVMKEETQGEDKKVVRGSEEMVDLYQRLGPVKPSNSTLAKWKRLVAAEQQLECHFPGCTFKSADLEVMIQHFGKCEKCPRRVYSCDLCDFQSKNEKEMQLHLTKEHFGNLEESDPDDPTSLKKMQSKLSNWKVCNKLLFLGREMSGTANGDRPFLPAVKWTLKFMQENYAKEDLFPDYHTTTKDWIPVPESEYSQYLPQTTESISFSTLAMREEVVSTDSVTFNWRRMKIFESDIIDGVPTLFTGGPIWALAWATNPLTAVENETRDQFLAVSCHQHMGDTYKSNERYVGKGLIQLWNFGPLDNLQRSTSNPKFALGIAHECGSVWDLEWCPSGCYETTSTNEHLQRLGLLAAACSDGCVHIFSVCFPNSLANDARYPIFRCKPVMTLTASENLTCELGGLPWSCLRLSWYKGKDHSVVAGGFNNGMVSLWNIRTESLLLRKEEDGTSILLPYKSFQAHLSCVTALSLSSQDEGRYLMTGSKDTTIKVWDMEDSSGPIPPVVRKGMVTDGIWLTHWLSSITSFDDVYSMGHCNTTLNPPRGYGFKLFPLLPQNSVTWSLSTTDWVNGIAQSTHAGELTVIFPHQLFLNVDTEKGNKDKRLILSYVELKDIVNETEKHKCESSCSVPCKKQQLGDLQKEIESNKSKNPSEYEKVMFQLEEKDESEKGGLSFVIERNPRKGKKCVITPLSEQIYDSTSVSDSSFANDNVNDGSDSLENIECISMLNQHEKRLLFTFKKDLERLNVTSRLKVTFPYYNNEKKKSNSNDTVKEFLMIVGSVNDDIKTENCSQESNGSAKAIQDDDSMFTIPSDDYEAVESKFGMIFCDFPANNLSTIPAASRLWTRKSETMKTAPVEIYPVTSLNKVKWNPNCRSFLWLAAGYQCGLLRVPCISGMHNKDVEQLLRHTTWQKV